MAAGRPQLVLVLPQGGPGGNDGAVGNLDPARVRAGGARAGRASRPPRLGAVLLSGHSGGGFAIKTILDDQVRRRTLSGVVWFDAVQAKSRETSTGQVERAKALISERIAGELDLLDDGGDRRRRRAALRLPLPALLPVAAAPTTERPRTCTTTCTGCSARTAWRPPPARTELAARIAALPEAARKALRERYQVLPVARRHRPVQGPATSGHDNMVGSGALQQAISAMPYGTAVEGETLARMPSARSRAPRRGPSRASRPRPPTRRRS